MKGEAVTSFIKLILSSAGIGFGANGLVAPLLDNSISVPVFFVQVTMFGYAALGAGLSLFFGDPIESRRSLFGQVAASTAFGVAVGVLLADGFNLEWAQKNLGMFVMVTAAGLRWFLPTIIEKGKQTIRGFKIPFSKHKSDGEQR